MSGGSFNYLCFMEPLAVSLEELQRMADSMAEYGDSAALEDMGRLIDCAEELQERWSALSDPMRAVEWHHSGDWSAGEAKNTLAHHALFDGRRHRNGELQARISRAISALRGEETP